MKLGVRTRNFARSIATERESLVQPPHEAQQVRKPPKLRHSVTALQALDLRVTQFFRAHTRTTYPYGMLRFTCDAILK